MAVQVGTEPPRVSVRIDASISAEIGDMARGHGSADAAG
jgi:hypothetical protein